MVLPLIARAVASGAARGAVARGAAAGGVRGAASRALAARSATGGAPPGVNLRSGVVQPTPGQTAAGQVQAQQTRSRSQIMMQAATRERARSTPVRTGGTSGRYWQGSGTEVIGGMPANYDRMSIAAPRSIDTTRQQKWVTDKMTGAVANRLDTVQPATENMIPYSQMRTGQGPLPPPRTPGVGMLPAPRTPGVGLPTMAPLYQPGQQQSARSSVPNAGPLYRGGSDMPVSQGVRFVQPAASNQRGSQPGTNQMFGSGVLWGEQTGGTIAGGQAWNANMPGSTLPGADDAANARVAAQRKAGAKQSALYRATLDIPSSYPRQGD